METEIEVQDDDADDGVQIIILDEEDFSQVIYEVQSPDTQEVVSASNEICVPGTLEGKQNCQAGDQDPQNGQSQILQIAFDSIVGSFNDESEIVEDVQDGQADEQMPESVANQSVEIITIDGNDVNTEAPEGSTTIALGIEFEGSNISDDIEMVKVTQRAVEEVSETCQEELQSFTAAQGCGSQNAPPLSLNKILCPTKPFGCAVCDMRFRDRSGLSKHMAEHTRDKPHECPHCPKSFGMESSWRKHISKCHQDETDFSSPSCCSLCKKVFKNEKSCNRHRQLVHDSGKFDGSAVIGTSVHECQKCNVIFGSQESLNRHAATKHPSLPCFYCGTLFLTKPLLRQHSREMHYQERPYACYKCWKRFKTGPEASVHLIEAHNVDLKRRRVGPGRQKDDMYSTNYYDKAIKFKEDGEIEESEETHTSNVIHETNEDNDPSLPEDPEHAFDLAARLEGKLSAFPAAVAKRNGRFPKELQQSKVSCSNPPKPFFTPPIFPPSCITRSSSDQALESSQNQEVPNPIKKSARNIKFTTKKTIKKQIQPKVKVKPPRKTRAQRIYKRNPKPTCSELISSATKIRPCRKRRRTDAQIRKMAELNGHIVAKDVRICLQVLPESILQKYLHNKNLDLRHDMPKFFSLPSPALSGCNWHF